DGKLLVGGSFTYFQQNERMGLARLNADGSLDLKFSRDVSGDISLFFSFVDALSVQTDGRILVGGAFGRVGETIAANLARLNPDGTVDTEFNAGRGPDGPVTNIAIQNDGRILIAGTFGSVDGVPSTSIARLHSSPPAQPPQNVTVLPASLLAGAGENATFTATAGGTLP